MVMLIVAGFAIAFFVARFFPELLDINPWFWLVIAILAVVKPVLKLFGISR